MEYRTLEYREQETSGIIILNRPEVRNAMNTLMLDEFMDLLNRIEGEPKVHVIIIKGNGKCFCAGADIAEMRDNTPEIQREMNNKFICLFNRLESLRKPVIASVHSHALAGGTELILACDIVIASDDAIFGLPEIKIGVFPGAGALVRILRWMSQSKAKELAMIGDPITAEEAVRIGLVNHVVKREQLEMETIAFAKILGRRPPLALGSLKATINLGGEMDLQKGIAYGLSEFLGLFNTEDQKEGMRAFLEKREAVFVGR